VIFKIIFIILLKLIADYSQKNNSENSLKSASKMLKKKRVKLKINFIIKFKTASKQLLRKSHKNLGYLQTFFSEMVKL